MVILSSIGIKVTNVTLTRYSDQIFLLDEMVKVTSKTYEKNILLAALKLAMLMYFSVAILLMQRLPLVLNMLILVW